MQEHNARTTYYLFEA